MTPIPYKGAQRILLPVALLCLLWVTLRVPAARTFVQDENWGFQLAGANQVLFGEHPFVDYRSVYGPLAFYGSALGQILSGRRVIGEIVLVLLGLGVAYVMLFRLMWRACGRPTVALVLLLLALATLPKMYKYYVVLGPVLSLSAAWNHLEKGSARSLWLLALAVAITGLFRPDFGGYALLSGAAAVGLRPAPQPGTRLKRLAGFLAAVIACASPWLLWLLFRGSLLPYFEQSLFGSAQLAKGMALPFPTFRRELPLLSDHNATCFLFLFSFALPPACLLLALLGRRAFPQMEWQKVVVNTVLAQGTLLQSTHRSDYSHLLQSIAISYVLAAWLVGLALAGLRAGVLRRRLMSLAGLGLAGGIAVVVLLLTTSYRLWPRHDLALLVQDLRLYSMSHQAFLDAVAGQGRGNWLLRAVQYVRRNTTPSQKIVALPLLPHFYYLADRPFGGGQMSVAPGLFSSPEHQVQMLARMSQEGVAVVVYLPDYKLDGRKDRKMANFCPLLYRHLEEDYVEIERFGPAVLKVLRKS